ncbi:MAG: FecR domain-containing protein [Burkholderiales bacterium]
MRAPRTLLWLLFCWLPLTAAAAPPAVLEGVVSPAWAVRGVSRVPLAPGADLLPGDEILTGAGARALLRMADGSQVKLGEKARFVVAAGKLKRGATPVFEATLRVLAGAFRFTTSALAKVAMRREVNIQLPTVTAGIRGTDLWGKATDDREFVVLIEGKIGVRRGSGEEVALDAPLSVFDAPKGAPDAAVTTVTQALLAEYARETEIESGSGGMRAGGRWKVTVLATADQSSALAAYDRLRDAGFPAAIAPRMDGTRTVYRVRIDGLPSSAEASALAVRLKTRFDYPEVSVSL